MDFETMLGMFFTLGITVMGLSVLVVYRVYGEVRRQRLVAMRFEERLAAFRHAVEVASEDA
jgi:hypothetical protein